ncbi:hypothetical protein FV232_01120 [Methylobacterium sp. WL30]|uniref:hypothetical protein n=1 Tax=unclassified Methylobacterium TaxID=2615210 RepID=UPI0011CC6F59|nr:MULTISPECIES: hypothetical protein [unclassified Methylobacterium]TXN38739.1 hypothetical protein FV225_12610 [Methylobacterium sp. WL93]TXN52233.1 hypothetical protein FV227_04050 [Methylobacterium sp. WL119]TXN70684.1 hypothetical protein FV232_01120 [Methylobacterium sp. WL30]
MDWRFSLFLLAMLGLLLGFSWGTSEGGLCSAPYVAKMLAEPSKDGALNCFEFWFNRYQTLIGVLGAVGAAAVTWVGVKQQINRLDEQVKFARVQFASNYLADLRERISVVEKIQLEFRQLCIWVGEIDTSFKNFLDAVSANMALPPDEIDHLYASRHIRKVGLGVARKIYGENAFQTEEQLVRIIDKVEDCARIVFNAVDVDVNTSKIRDEVQNITKDTLGLCGVINMMRESYMHWHGTLQSKYEIKADFPSYEKLERQIKYKEYRRVSDFLEKEISRLRMLRDRTTEDADKALF